MGMSASQARLLMLTARQNDLEFEAQQISQTKLLLAQQVDAVASEYSDKIANTELTVLQFSMETNQYEKADLTFTNLISSGYFLIDSSGRAVMSEAEYNALVASGTTPGSEVVVDGILDRDDGGADSYLKGMVESGQYRFAKQDEEGIQETGISQTNIFNEGYDTSDDARAEAEYEAQTKKLQTKEKKLDLRLKQIETQHSAIKTEVESVEKIIEDNVKSTFQIFS